MKLNARPQRCSFNNNIGPCGLQGIFIDKLLDKIIWWGNISPYNKKEKHMLEKIKTGLDNAKEFKKDIDCINYVFGVLGGV